MQIKKLSAHFVAFFSVSLLTISSAYAEEETTIENAFSQCGIGAALFTKNETAAIISNVIWDLGTTALSSQSSSPESCSGAPTTAAIFIDQTYPVLEEQFVKGSGTHVTALMDILQCGVDVQAAVVANVQSELAISFSDAEFAAAPQQAKALKMAGILDQATASCSA